LRRRRGGITTTKSGGEFCDQYDLSIDHWAIYGGGLMHGIVPDLLSNISTHTHAHSNNNDDNNDDDEVGGNLLLLLLLPAIAAVVGHILTITN
jgi:hypothetical protein